MRKSGFNHTSGKGRASARRAVVLGAAAVLAVAAAGCEDSARSSGGEVVARHVEPRAVLARLGAAEALAAAASRAAPAEQVAGYYARRAAGEAPTAETAGEAEAADWPPSSLRNGSFAPQSLPIPSGGVAATRLFAPPDLGAHEEYALEAANGAQGGFIRSEPPPPHMTASLNGFATGAPPAGPEGRSAPAGGLSSGGVATVGASGRDPFQDFLEALHDARSGEDLRRAAESLALEATAPAALTLAGSFESESPDVAVAVYDALWRVRNLPEAARRMGVAARDGRGVAQDAAAAAAYFREAAAFGDLTARRLLEEMGGAAAGFSGP